MGKPRVPITLLRRRPGDRTRYVRVVAPGLVYEDSAGAVGVLLALTPAVRRVLRRVLAARAPR